MPELVAGIDLGTSTSAIGYYAESAGRFAEVRLVGGDYGLNWIRSAVLYDPASRRWLAGAAAWNRRRVAAAAPYYVVSPKRALGVERTLSLAGQTRLTDAVGVAEEITPSLLLGKVLAELKRRAEALGEGYRLGPVVVGVPMVYMSDEAALTREAVELAGLELLDLIQEPTAAALCYVHDSVDMNDLREGERILVFDLGGGTFDITVFQLYGQSADELALDVLQTGGVRRLGGDDVDAFLLDHLRGQGLTLPEPTPADLRAEIMERIENELKVPLSNASDDRTGAYFSIDRAGIAFSAELTRAEFAALLTDSPLYRQIEAECARVAAAVGSVDRVMLVGGSANLPIVRPLLQRVFGVAVRVNSALALQEAVVRGATYRAAQLRGRRTGKRRIVLRNHGRFAHDLGIVIGLPGQERFAPLLRRGAAFPLAEPVSQTFAVHGATPLSLLPVEGDADAPLSAGSAHRRYGSIDLGVPGDGAAVVVSLAANAFGEVTIAAEWPGGRVGPQRLQPATG